jgi:outer membrane putative beta-barrel porin/alpha-amylase
MKRVSLICAPFLSITLFAQMPFNRPPIIRNLVGQYSTSLMEERGTHSEFGGGLSSSLSGDQRSATPQAKSPRTKKRKEHPKPPIAGSMVGYIDNAIVGSQIRMRFDAGFHNNAPDRAEFFYPQCSCINGPGPNPVIANLNFQQLYMRAEYAPVRRFSLFTEVPFRWIQPKLQIVPSDSTPLPNEAGISDIAAGIKLAAVASPIQFVTFQAQAYFPSGRASTGLGTNHYTFEPALLYYRSLSNKLTLEAQVGDWHPIGGSSCPRNCNNQVSSPAPATQHFAGDVFFYGVGPSYIAYESETVRIAPVLELVGWKVLGGFVTDATTATSGANGSGGFQGATSSDGTNIVNLKIGARTSVGNSNSFYVGFGQAVTHSVWYGHIVRAEYRYTF